MTNGFPDYEDLEIAKQHAHRIKIKVELLDYSLMTGPEVTGDVVSASMNIDSSSDIRRTASVVMCLDRDTFSSEEFELSWLSKAVRISLGVLYEGNYVWYVLGSMLLNEDTYSYDAANHELSLSLVDLMASATEARGSQLGLPVRIERDSVIKNALNGIISRYTDYRRTDIDDFPDVVPYDLDVNDGVYPIDLLKKIISLFPTYEQYYDTNGTYNVHVIPTKVNSNNVAEQNFLDETILDDLIISERRTFNASSVKNSTEIWGRTLSADYVATGCTHSGATYNLTFLTNLETIESNSTYSITPDVDNPASPQVHIDIYNSAGVIDTTATSTLPLLSSTGQELAGGEMVAGVPYVIKCLTSVVGDTTVKKFYLQGQKLIHVIVREMNEMPTGDVVAQDKADNACDDIQYVINPDSPYACDRNGMSLANGEIKQVLTGGDYSSIYTTDLAFQRAKYENYLKARLNTDVELKTVLIPFMDVNKKIQYTSPITGDIHQYLVKSVAMDLSGYTMTMRLSRFYSYYPW